MVIPCHAQYGRIYLDPDSTISPQFIKTLCHTVRYDHEMKPGSPLPTEKLILVASGAHYKREETPEISKRWHNQHGAEIYCEVDENYPAGDFLRQIILSNNRDFANIVGPKNRLSLDLEVKDPRDQLNIYEFIDQQLAIVEDRYDNDRAQFQQDEGWRNMMFFYFLFSEYKINYDAEIKE
ncbi:hypothetical protein E1176_03720 [Fulvivirga sp. RKSG066]|uniref:hypothetical protein n=1 Tax=Fulvivirga aurantia TaxID=2529383 RepID=UPI0012BC4C99|nr:hypothetical protein [Fulvivirga aurantia]MTI20117.1 hypothetical protein [Fulvivirga aurantia]